jgi:hypothetical protein
MPKQWPDRQTSVSVQAFPSSHDVPFAAMGPSEHVPLAGSHVPARWHCSDAVQTTGFDPVQTPDRHVSVCVQPFPSLHPVPSGAVGFEQVPVAELHVPAAWH